MSHKTTSATSGDDYVSTSELEHVLFMYTDGCCLGNSTKLTCPTGWGVTISKPNALPSVSSGRVSIQSLENDASKCGLVDELCGPVVLEVGSPFYLGATVGSNNTAELTAIGEALLWLLRHCRSSNAAQMRFKRVFIRYDSEYAAKSIQGIFNGNKNVELIHKIRSIYREAKSLVKSVTFLHVKGHSGHLYNDRADELANQGAVMPSGVGGRYNDSAVIVQTAIQVSNVPAASVGVADANTQEDSIHAVDLPLVLFLYTDGCCIGNNTQHSCPTGWGVTITRPTAAAALSNAQRIDIRSLECDTSKCEKVDELFGPVILDGSSPFYLGATVGSNNTAELTAIGEALLWLLAHVRTLHQQNSSDGAKKTSRLRAYIRYDSEYAAKSVQGIFNGKKNVELIDKIRVILRKVKSVVGSVTFLHVKGHSGHLYNDRADELANQGANMTSGTGGRYFEGDAYNIDIAGMEKDTSNAASHSDNITQAFDTSEVKGRVSHRSGTGVELSSGNHDYLAERTRIPVKPVLSLFKNSTTSSSSSGSTNVVSSSGMNSAEGRGTPRTPSTTEVMQASSGVKRKLEITPLPTSKRCNSGDGTVRSGGSDSSGRGNVIDLTEVMGTAVTSQCLSGSKEVISLVESDCEGGEEEEDQLVFLSEDEED